MSGARGRLRRARAWLIERQKPLIFAAAATVFLGNQGCRRLVGHWLELRRLRREIAALEGEKRQVDGEAKLLQSSRATLERMARKELGFIKPGEIEYRFPPPR